MTDKSDLPDLLPCPACGNKADYGSRDVRNSYGEDFYIFCEGCDFQTRTFYSSAHNHNECYREPTEAWNTRAEDARPTELEIIKAFFERVERRAEYNMLKTHKLEGSHYAAMKVEIAALEEAAQQGE